MRQPDLGLKFVIVIIATHGPPDRFFLIKRRRRPSGKSAASTMGGGLVVCFSVYGGSLQNQHVDYRGAFFLFLFFFYSEGKYLTISPVTKTEKKGGKGKISDNSHC